MKKARNAQNKYVVPRFIGLITAPGPRRTSLAPHKLPPTDWLEFAAYTEGSRAPWLSDKPVNFSISSPGKLWGIFVSLSNVKMSDTNEFVALAAFSSDIEVAEGNILRVVYPARSSGGVRLDR